MAFQRKVKDVRGVIEIQNMQVCVDPRIELLSIVQYFSDYGSKHRPLTELDSGYSQAVLAHFAAHKEHGAVRLYSELVQRGFNFSYPMELAVNLAFAGGSNAIFLENPVPIFVKERAGGQERIDSFVQLLGDYAKQSDFRSFFAVNQPLYGQIVEEVKNKLAGFNITHAFSAYFGVHYQDYILILNPLCDAGGYGIWQQDAKGGIRAYSITGPVAVEQGQLLFVGDPIGLCAFNWHEYGHSVVNPLTAGQLSDVQQFEQLFAPVAAKMEKLAYGTWEMCLNEHIVRACVIRLLFRQFGRERGQELLQYERELGFYLVDPLLEWLKTYEAKRDCYPSFAKYFPSIIPVLASQSPSAAR